MSDTVTIPATVWKDTLVKVDALAAENERLRKASFVTAVPSDVYEKLKEENKRFREAFKNIEQAWYKGRSSYIIAIVDDALAKQSK